MRQVKDLYEIAKHPHQTRRTPLALGVPPTQ